MNHPDRNQQNLTQGPLREIAENTMSHPIEPPQSPEGTANTVSPPPAGYFSTPLPLSEQAPARAHASSTEPKNSSKTAATADLPTVPQAGRHPARVGTIVWGAVVLVLGILLILSTQLHLNLDPGLTAMWLLLGAGVAMVAGGAINLFTRMKKQRGVH